MTEIQSFVKKLKIKDFAIYQQKNLEITVLMNNGKRAKIKTTGCMTLQKIVDAIIERLEQ